MLVDEYDKPILDALTVPDIARANRDYLRGIYAVIKDNDAHIKFTFLTGVSKFSKVSLFSGLNNLTDITMDPAYSAVCGYTDADLDAVFAPELPGLDREEVRDWYNGYSWLGEETVYNPFDILCSSGAASSMPGGSRPARRRFWSRCFSSAESAPWRWMGYTGPAICYRPSMWTTLRRRPCCSRPLSHDQGRGRSWRESLYRLGYPNREVRQSLNRSLLRHMVQDPSRQIANSIRLYKLLKENDFSGLATLFQAFFASIPCEWYTKNDIARYEGYYASVFYSYFAALGLDVAVEDSSSRGRLDMAVRFNGNIYLFEFKVVEMAPEGAAMAQLKSKRYADKYRDSANRFIWLPWSSARTLATLRRSRVERA